MCARLALAAALSLTLALPALARQDDAPPSDDAATAMQEAQRLVGEESFDEAAAVLRGITRRDPENGRAWFMLGYALHGAGRLDEAMPAHLMAAEFDAVAPTAMYNIACVYALKENRDKAFAWLERAAEAGFRRADALRGDPDLASLRDDERWEPFFKKYARPGTGLVALTKEQADARRRAQAGAPRGDTDASPEETTAAPSEPAIAIAALDPPRQLDFWVGTWDVFRPDGRKVGTNRIEQRIGGHVIFEDWTSVRGGRGQSMNYFDPSKAKWVQVWVDGEGGIIVKEGGFRDGAMRLEGRHILPDGTTRSFRSSLTPDPDGSIRQLIEESEDDGATWKTWFDGRYERQQD
jgi:hypothetical protein